MKWRDCLLLVITPTKAKADARASWGHENNRRLILFVNIVNCSPFPPKNSVVRINH